MKPSSFARLRCCQARSLAVVALAAMASGLTGTFANPQTADLIRASERGDLPVVNAMLSQGDVSLNAKRRDTGGTALLLASENGHLKVVQALLAAGADVNAKGYGGFTALIWASRRTLKWFERCWPRKPTSTPRGTILTVRRCWKRLTMACGRTTWTSCERLWKQGRM